MQLVASAITHLRTDKLFTFHSYTICSFVPEVLTLIYNILRRTTCTPLAKGVNNILNTGNNNMLYVRRKNENRVVKYGGNLGDSVLCFFRCD